MILKFNPKWHAHEQTLHSDTQISDVSALTKGTVVLECHQNEAGVVSKRKIVIASKPYQDALGQWQARYRAFESSVTLPFSLADHGVSPYAEGFWAKNNWIETV